VLVCCAYVFQVDALDVKMDVCVVVICAVLPKVVVCHSIFVSFRKGHAICHGEPPYFIFTFEKIKHIKAQGDR